MSELTSKLDIAYIATALMISSSFAVALAGFQPTYTIIAMCLFAVLYLIAMKVDSIWNSAILYSFCLAPVTWVLTINRALDSYIAGNNYFGVYQAMVATCICLFLYYIIQHEPYAVKAFLAIMIIGIILTRNYTCIYCLFLLIYLFSPLGFKIRRFISKYLRLIRLLTLPFILISLPLIILTNVVASSTVYMLLFLAFYNTILKPKELYNAKD